MAHNAHNTFAQTACTCILQCDTLCTDKAAQCNFGSRANEGPSVTMKEKVRIARLNNSTSHFRMVAELRLTMRKSARLVTKDRETVEVYEEERDRQCVQG
eukprot:5543226-Amphidinium_carterae.1